MDLSRLHQITTATLDNGLQIYVNRREPAPVVTVQAWVRTGSVHEDVYLGCGLSHFLEHMLFHGSSRYPGDAVTETVHRLGGDMNAYTSLGHTVYYLELPAEHVEVAIDILADMVISPAFPDAKFSDEKNIILRECDMHGDNPSRVLSEKVWHETFTVHPARHPIIGYRNLIETVDRRMMADYHSRRYSPERTFFLISGLVDPDTVIAAVAARAAGWPRLDLREPYLPEEPAQLCRRESVFHYPDPLVRHALTWQIPDGGHPDIPALDVLSAILGQNRSSRLVKTLKLERDLALGVSSFSYSPTFCGVFGITALCTPAKAEELEKELLKEIDAAMSGSFSVAELEREVVQLSTEYLRAMRSNGTIAKILGNSILTYGSPAFVTRYLEELRRLTPDDVSRVAREYLNPDRLTLIRLLPNESRGTLFAPPPPPAVNIATAFQPELRRLPSGPRLILLPERSVPLIDLGLILPGGVFFEKAAQSGISNLMASLLTAGAGPFSELELLQEFDDHAIDFTVSPGNNSLALRLNCHRDQLSHALVLLHAMLTSPRFGEAEFEREKNAAIEKLRSRQESPQSLADDKMLALLYGRHPYSKPRSGTLAGIEKLTANQLRTYYRQVCLVPERMVFGAAGDFDPERIEDFFRGLCRDLEWSSTPLPNVTPPRFGMKKRQAEVTNSRSQAVVMTALPGCDNLCEERYVIDLLQAAMNGQGSKLFRQIREEDGLAYYTGLSTARGFHRGYLSLYAGTSPDHAAEVAERLGEECRRLAENGLEEEEFAAGRASLDHAESEQIDNPGSMMMQCCLAEYYGNGYLAPLGQREIYRDFRLDQVNRTVKALFSQAGRVTVICRPGAE